MGLNEKSVTIERKQGMGYDRWYLLQYDTIVAHRDHATVDAVTLARALDAQKTGSVIDAAAILFPDVFAEPEAPASAKTVGECFADEPLLFVAWLRFPNAHTLFAAAQWWEEKCGRDPDAVRVPAEERRFLAMAWPLEQLRAGRLPDAYQSDADLIEREGGAWALAYGLGVSFVGSIAGMMRDAGFTVDVAGVRVQAADARFPSSTESVSDEKDAGDPGIFADGTPDGQPGPALAVPPVVESDVPPGPYVDESDPDNDCGAQG
jgi:hypothetical protein